MVLIGLIVGLLLLWLVLDLWGLTRRGGLLVLESQHPPEMAAIWLRVASGYKLVLDDATKGLFVWEQGRRFHDGGLFYYAEMWRDRRSGRARFAIGVIGHRFHTAAELAAARARFVSTQVFHLTERSACDAVERAANPRTARRIHRAMKRLAGRQTHRPPPIEAPMSPFAVRLSLHAPLASIVRAIADLSPAGWRLVETASLNRGLTAQHRCCFRDGTQGGDSGTEYLLEVCPYASGWTKLAIDWFPGTRLSRPPRPPTELEADLRRKVEQIQPVSEAAE